MFWCCMFLRILRILLVWGPWNRIIENKEETSNLWYLKCCSLTNTVIPCANVPVVLPEEQSVDGGQAGLDNGSLIPGHEVTRPLRGRRGEPALGPSGQRRLPNLLFFVIIIMQEYKKRASLPFKFDIFQHCSSRKPHFGQNSLLKSSFYVGIRPLFNLTICPKFKKEGVAGRKYIS